MIIHCPLNKRGKLAYIFVIDLLLDILYYI